MYVYGTRKLFGLPGYVVAKISMTGDLVQVNLQRDMGSAPYIVPPPKRSPRWDRGRVGHRRRAGVADRVGRVTLNLPDHFGACSKWVGLDAAIGDFGAGHIALGSGNGDGEPADFFSPIGSLGYFKITKAEMKK